MVLLLFLFLFLYLFVILCTVHFCVIRKVIIMLPNKLISYIKYDYANCSIQLKYNKRISPRISVNRDVKQGDPISHLLFNSVNDYENSDLPSYISIHNNNIVIWHSIQPS